MTDEGFAIEGYAPGDVMAALGGKGCGDVTAEEAAEVARGLNAVVAAEIAGGVRGARVELAAELLAGTRRRRAELEAVPVPYVVAIVECGDGVREKAVLTRVPTDGLDVDGIAAACIPAGQTPLEVRRGDEVLKVAEVVGEGVLTAKVADPAAYIAAAPDDAALPEGMYLRALQDLCEERCWGVERQARGSYLIDARDCLGAKVLIDVSGAMGRPEIADPGTWVAAAGASVEAALSELEVDAADPNYAIARSFRAEALRRELPDIVGEAARTARWRSLDPEMVPVQEAAWALTMPDGRQAVAECHLTDEEESPWGFAFYFAGFTFEPDEGKWVEQDGGLFWGHTRADDPELAMEAICSCGSPLDPDRVVEIDYDLLEGIGLWSQEGRPLTPEEMGGQSRDISPAMAPAEIELAVEELEDVLVDDDGRIIGGWRGYPAGTDREEIWHDIDEAHPDGYVALAKRLGSHPRDGRHTRP